MNEIKRQVTRARRRIMQQQFIGIAAWTVFAGLLAAVVALIIPRVWVLDFTSTESSARVWTWSWIAGGLCGGLLVAIAWTYFARRGELDAAIELDRRFGLKERVSTALSLRSDEVNGAAGQALLNDAKQRVEAIDVNEQFKLATNWKTALPVIPALVAVLLALLVDCAFPEPAAAAKEESLDIQKRVQTSEDQFRDKLTSLRRDMEDKGLKDAAEWLKEIEQQFENSRTPDKATRKEALVRLNNVKQQIEQKQNQLAKTEAMRKRLSQLKDIKKGPADEAIQAMKNSDFGQAMDEVNKLADQLRNDQLNDEQKQQMREQIEKLQEQLADHEKQKEQLRDEIAAAEKSGNNAKAEQLKKDLEKLQKMDPDMQQLQQLAKQLESLKNSLNNDDLQQAADDLEQLASQLQDLQNELDQLETLDQMMDQIAQAKSQMNCQQCQGQGCATCGGQGQGQRDQLAQSSDNGAQGGQGKGEQNRQPGGLGEGQGEGARPERKNDTGHFLSKVDADPQRGEIERIGDADGPNTSGVSREQAKQTVQSRMSKAPDPVVEQALPREQRDHVKEYFEQFTKRRE